jgi:beta-glucanase (GH16 family)
MISLPRRFPAWLLVACGGPALTLLAEPPAGSQWEPIPELTDEFAGKSLDPAKWHDGNPEWPGRPPGFFSKQNVSVSDGKLHLTAKAEDLPNLPKGYQTFTTAAVKSKALVKYGYFEIKCRPMKSRASSAFWFYCNTKEIWTEIDVFEICGTGDKKRDDFMTVHVFHTPTETKHWAKGTKWTAPFDLAADDHVYALEWDQKTIKWSVDGKVVREQENTHWHQPLHMNFDSETMPEWFGLPDKKELPAVFSIEYIRSWKKAEAKKRGDGRQ